MSFSCQISSQAFGYQPVPIFKKEKEEIMYVSFLLFLIQAGLFVSTESRRDGD